MENRKSIAKDYYFGKEWFDIKRLTDNVWGIREPFHQEDVLSFYVQGSKRSVLIDSGMGLADITATSSEIKDAAVLLTHSHWDHVGGASDFAQVSIFDEAFETERLKKGWRPKEMVGFSKKSFSLPLPNDFFPEVFDIPGINGFSTFRDQEIIDLGSMTIQVLHTPGHTPGSVCFFIPELGYLFTGDTLYAGPEYLHLPDSDWKQYFLSLNKIKELTADRLKVIFPGHNGFTARPQLLDRHILASYGLIKPSKIEEGLDEFGPYKKKYYDDFSLMLPR